MVACCEENSGHQSSEHRCWRKPVDLTLAPEHDVRFARLDESVASAHEIMRSSEIQDGAWMLELGRGERR